MFIMRKNMRFQGWRIQIQAKFRFASTKTDCRLFF